MFTTKPSSSIKIHSVLIEINENGKQRFEAILIKASYKISKTVSSSTAKVNYDSN